MNDQKNLILAIVLSVAILGGFHYFYELPRQKAAQAARLQQQQAAAQLVTDGQAATDSATPPVAVPGAQPAVPDRQTALAATPRIRINTPSLHGSLPLTGVRIDDLTLAGYHVAPNPDSAEVVLLAPAGVANPYFAEFGWIAGPDSPVAVPGPGTVWTADADTLTPEQPVILTWDNGQGVVFERRISIDNQFLFTVTQRVRNSTDQPVTLYPYGRVVREGTPKTEGIYLLHEGPIGVLNGTLKEINYKDLVKDGPVKTESTGGWLGITDKYWLVGLVPDASASVTASFGYQNRNADLYQADYRGGPLTIAAGQTTEVTGRLFAGAKQVRLLDQYAQQHGISKFDLAVDFGWFYFLTKPFFYALDWLGRSLGNFGLGILAFTVVLRLAFFPLANKQFKAMAKMKKLQPQMEALRAKFGDDRQGLSMAMMELYKKEGANPLSGCLPIVLQIPVFFALYKVLYVTIEMRHAPFYGWIRDLSAADPTTLFNLFGLIPWTPPSFLHIGVWPLAMGVTMYLQQKLNPAQVDPIQQRVFMALPFVFTYMMAAFPAGLVIYWTWSNLLTITQQWFILRRTNAGSAK